MNQFLGLDYALPLTVDLIDDTRVSNTLTLSKRFLTYGVSFWRFTIRLEPDYRDSNKVFEKLTAHYAWHKSGREFNIACPQTSITTPLDSHVPATFTAEDGNIFSFTGTTIGANALGRFVKLSNRGKLYKVVSSSVEDNASKLLLYPEVNPADLPTGTTMIFHSFEVAVVYDPSGDFSVTYDGDGLTSVTIVVDENV